MDGLASWDLKANKRRFQPGIGTLFCDLCFEGAPPVPTALDRSYRRAVATGPSMENPNERNLLMGKHRHIIAKAAREKELERERERELERISKANRASAVSEQNLFLSNERMKRLTIRPQVPFKEAPRASLGAVNATKERDEVEDDKTSNFPLLMAAISELYGSRSIFDDGPGVQWDQETKYGK